MKSDQPKKSKKQKKSKADMLLKGADLAIKAAGVAGIILGGLAFLVSISNPISLAIIGGVAIIFFCVGAISEYRNVDPKIEHAENLEIKLTQIEEGINKMRDHKIYFELKSNSKFDIKVNEKAANDPNTELAIKVIEKEAKKKGGLFSLFKHKKDVPELVPVELDLKIRQA